MKKLIKNTFMFAFIAILFTACSGDKVAGDFKTTGDYRWRKTDKYVFDFDLKAEEANKVYKLDATVRHTEGIAYNKIPLSVTVTSPSGAEQKIDKDLVIKESVNFVGEAMGDYVDTRVTLSEAYKCAEIGTYTINITHALEDDIANNVMDVGFELLKIKGAK